MEALEPGPRCNQDAALFAWLVMMMLVIGLLPFAFLLKPDTGDHTGGR